MKIKSIFLIVFLTAACAPTIKNFENYQKQFLTKSQFLPTEENLSAKMPKIVVFALEENDNQTAKQANLGSAMANNIENILSKHHLAQLVDRKAASKLEKEIQLIEMNKTGSYKGPQIADYAVSGAIGNAGFTKKYSSGSTFYDPKSRTFVTIPPRFTYKAEVAGNIKIYELPSMTVAQNIDFKGLKSRTENVQQRGGLSLGGLQIGGEQANGDERDDNLVRRAGEDAVNDVIVDIKNALIQKGYILEKRIYKNKTIFKISLGSDNGIKHGDKFEISGQYEVENPITNKIEIEKRIIAKGTVADKIDPKSCWVVIDGNTDQIRLGDIVKMKYKKSSLDSFLKISQSMLE